MDNREAAFAAHPLPSLGENAGIMEDGRFIKQDASAVYRTRKRDLLWVEIVKGGFSLDLVWLIAENIENRVRSKQDVGIRCEVWAIQVSARHPSPTRPVIFSRLDLL